MENKSYNFLHFFVTMEYLVIIGVGIRVINLYNVIESGIIR